MSTKKTPSKAEQKPVEKEQQKPVKPKMRKVRYAVTADGGKHLVLRQDGKYLYCEDTTIRLASDRLTGIETATIAVEQ